MIGDKRFTLALHGGAGPKRGHDYGVEIAHMRGLVEAARDRLAAGAGALDVAVETVVAAGGPRPLHRRQGRLAQRRRRIRAGRQLDGRRHPAGGSVAALQGFESPILAARAVMEKTPHVMLAGEGAMAFAPRAGD